MIGDHRIRPAFGPALRHEKLSGTAAAAKRVDGGRPVVENHLESEVDFTSV